MMHRAKGAVDTGAPFKLAAQVAVFIIYGNAGEGEKTEKLKHKVQQFRMSVPCHFHGKLSRQEARGILQTSHVLLITSLRDVTSTAAIKGLALGLPIICLDHGASSHVVTTECGVKIPVTSPRKVAEEIADSATKMWAHEDWRQELALGALERARFFTWDKQAGRVNELYHEVVSTR